MPLRSAMVALLPGDREPQRTDAGTSVPALTKATPAESEDQGAPGCLSPRGQLGANVPSVGVVLDRAGAEVAAIVHRALERGEPPELEAGIAAQRAGLVEAEEGALGEIGRASGRERVEISVVAG